MAASNTKQIPAPIFLGDLSESVPDSAGDEALKKALAETKLVLFDCDGVLWRSSSAIAPAPAMLTALKAAGKKIAYVTNNSSKPRSAYVEKINAVLADGDSLPSPAVEDIFGSAYATALHLKSLGVGKGDTVFVVGEPGLAEELELTSGVTCIGQDLASFDFDMSSTPEEIKRAVQEQPVAAVVVGFDSHLCYVKIAFASSHLRYNPDCIFVATNRDMTYPTSAGILLPGGGTAVCAVEAGSGRLVQGVAGKPSTALMDVIAQEHGLQRRADGSWPCLMVGDRLDTDIKFANEANMPSLLVLSGVTSLLQARGLQGSSEEPTPTFVAKDVGILSLSCS